MMFSKAQQEIVNLALQGKRLKEVVMLLDKSEDEILLDTPAGGTPYSKQGTKRSGTYRA